MIVEELLKPIRFQEMLHHLYLRGLQRRSAEHANVNWHCGKDYGHKRVWDFMSEIGLRLESNPELYVVF